MPKGNEKPNKGLPELTSIPPFQDNLSTLPVVSPSIDDSEGGPSYQSHFFNPNVATATIGSSADNKQQVPNGDSPATSSQNQQRLHAEIKDEYMCDIDDVSNSISLTTSFQNQQPLNIESEDEDMWDADDVRSQLSSSTSSLSSRTSWISDGVLSDDEEDEPQHTHKAASRSHFTDPDFFIDDGDDSMDEDNGELASSLSGLMSNLRMVDAEVSRSSASVPDPSQNTSSLTSAAISEQDLEDRALHYSKPNQTSPARPSSSAAKSKASRSSPFGQNKSRTSSQATSYPAPSSIDRPTLSPFTTQTAAWTKVGPTPTDLAPPHFKIALPGIQTKSSPSISATPTSPYCLPGLSVPYRSIPSSSTLGMNVIPSCSFFFKNFDHLGHQRSWDRFPRFHRPFQQLVRLLRYKRAQKPRTPNRRKQHPAL